MAKKGDPIVASACEILFKNPHLANDGTKGRKIAFLQAGLNIQLLDAKARKNKYKLLREMYIRKKAKIDGEGKTMAEFTSDTNSTPAVEFPIQSDSSDDEADIRKTKKPRIAIKDRFDYESNHYQSDAVGLIDNQGNGGNINSILIEVKNEQGITCEIYELSSENEKNQTIGSIFSGFTEIKNIVTVNGNNMKWRAIENLQFHKLQRICGETKDHYIFHFVPDSFISKEVSPHI